MQRTFALFLIAACAYGTSAQAIIRCELNGQAINVSNGAELAGKSGLVRCRDDSTGQLQREKELRNGKFIGLERMFDREGRVQRERTVNERGNSHGRVVEFWPDGKVRREETADDGRTQGAVRRFDASGRVVRVSFHAEGQEQFYIEYNPQGQPTRLFCPRASVLPEDRKPCGFDGATDTLLYTESGARAAQLRYEKGQLLDATEWSSDGAISAQQRVEDGRRVHRNFYTDGGKSVLREERIFAPDDRSLRDTRGQLLSTKRFAASGQIIEQRRYAEGREVQVERWYQNGSLRERILWSGTGAQARLLRESYRDDGALARRERLNADEWPVGTQQAFHPNGRLAVEEQYSEPDARGRTRPVARKQWDETGRLVADDILLEDGSRQRKAASGLES
jgi:antitoxin component YwqK of YwqJK toxin-antitoxin module